LYFEYYKYEIVFYCQLSKKKRDKPHVKYVKVYPKL